MTAAQVMRELALCKINPKTEKAASRWIEEVKLYTNYRPGMAFSEFTARPEVKIQLWHAIERYRIVMTELTQTPRTLEGRLLRMAETQPVTLKVAAAALPQYATQSIRMALCGLKTAGKLETLQRGVYTLAPRE